MTVETLFEAAKSSIPISVFIKYVVYPIIDSALSKGKRLVLYRKALNITKGLYELMEMRKDEVSLCGRRGDGSWCPSVTISPTSVTIGEKGNKVKLKKTEWNKLVDLVKTGKLKKA